nr:hypothetical protein [Tanacetum cinerariifolium]
MAQQQVIRQAHQYDACGDPGAYGRGSKKPIPGRVSLTDRATQRHRHQRVRHHREEAAKAHQPAEKAGAVDPSPPQNQVQLHREPEPAEASGDGYEAAPAFKRIQRCTGHFNQIPDDRRMASRSLGAREFDVQRFDLFPRPGCLAQERQAGFDTRIAFKAANVNPLGEAGPLVMLDQRNENLLQGYAVQGIVIGCGHDRPVDAD